MAFSDLQALIPEPGARIWLLLFAEGQGLQA